MWQIWCAGISAHHRAAPKGEGDRCWVDCLSHNKLLVVGEHVDSECQTVANESLTGSAFSGSVVHSATGGGDGCCTTDTTSSEVVSAGWTFRGGSHFWAQEKTQRLYYSS